ncbi:hypothetical protein PIB30_067633 [Stylosanthes scabra]|uniref:Retrotransposon gag domain-containing protein n=1 Tax=Stylosanthes scabra TaxID=79078 RepID=A0ABU6XMP8_9FABA|nr:hypothetical protein [Stylosanthes scabra]
MKIYNFLAKLELVREISRKRLLLHLPCLWTSIQKKDYLCYTKELRRRPELSPLRSRQVSASDLPRRQLIDSLMVITLRVMISLEIGNRHCRVCVDGKLQMPERRRGNRRVTLASPTSNGGQPDLVNAYADIAAAIREPTAAIRESNAARDRERQRNGNGNGDRNGDGIQRLLGRVSNAITWDEFREEFYKKYFPQSARSSKDLELPQFKQGRLFLAEYIQTIEDLCRLSQLSQGDPIGFEN